MGKYKLLDGVHVDGSKMFRKGQIVESDKDLASTFRGKFLRIDAPPADEPATKDDFSDQPVIDLKDRPGWSPDPKPKSTLPGGSVTPAPIPADGLAQKAAPTELTKQAGQTSPTDAGKAAAGAAGKKAADPKQEKPSGTDVTKDFKKAQDQLYYVFKRNNLYYVYDEDDTAKPVNETGVKAEEVDGVIEKALKKD